MDADDRQEATGSMSPREAVRMRAQASGKRMVPPQPDELPSWADVVEAGSGAGSSVSEALAEERAGEPLRPV